MRIRALLAISLLACSSCMSSIGDSMAGCLVASQAAGSFYASEGRWPRSRDELERGAQLSGERLEPGPVHLLPQTDGRLLIRCDTGRGLFREESETYLNPADIERQKANGLSGYGSRPAAIDR